MCVSVFIWADKCMHTWRPKADVTCLSQLLFTLFGGTGALMEPGVTDLTDWPESPRRHHSHPAPCQAFYAGARDLNSGAHVGKHSTN